eukprot:3132489-Amphidinium_carterae.2
MTVSAPSATLLKDLTQLWYQSCKTQLQRESCLDIAVISGSPRTLQANSRALWHRPLSALTRSFADLRRSELSVMLGAVISEGGGALAGSLLLLLAAAAAVAWRCGSFALPDRPVPSDSGSSWLTLRREPCMRSRDVRTNTTRLRSQSSSWSRDCQENHLDKLTFVPRRRSADTCARCWMHDLRPISESSHRVVWCLCTAHGRSSSSTLSHKCIKCSSEPSTYCTSRSMTAHISPNQLELCHGPYQMF